MGTQQQYLHEFVYRQRDNTLDFLLKVNTLTDPIKRIFDLSDVTRMVLVREDGFVIDSEKNSIFDWSSLASSGIVTIQLGLISIKPGRFKWRLVVYDSTNPEGLDWGGPFWLTVDKEYAEF